MPAVFRATALLLALFTTAASGADDDRSGQVWINAGSISHHLDRKYDYNERNYGLGLEYKLDARRSLFAGAYKNSMFRLTRYAGMSYTPFQLGPARIGVVVGVADGYREMRNGGFFPAISPVISVEGERFGVNILVIPSIASNVSNALALQFKIKVGG